MGRGKLALVVGAAVAVSAFGAVALSGYDYSDVLERDVASTLAVPDEIPEWTSTTRPASNSTTTTTAGSAPEPPVATGAVISEEETDVTLHVDAENGSDTNSGLEASAALATVGRALDLASEFRLGGQRVRVVLAPGIYRESVAMLQDPEDTPLLVIEAAEPGTAILSGADVWTDWAWSEDDAAFVHTWPFDWDPAPDVEEVVGRREIVVVEGVRLEQVVRAQDLTAGSFFVDARSDRLLMLPPEGSPFTGLAAEVAVRERTLNLDSVRNVVVRGLTLQHAASPFESSAVRISNSRNVLFEANRVVENSWTGLGLSTSSALTVRDNVINENGGGGAGMFQVRDVVFDGNDTSLNNWRGVRGDHVGWSIAGVKAVGIREVAFVRHRAWWNSTRGLWLDYDVRDISIDDSSWCHNLTDGLFVEATPGPVRVRGVDACENGRYGLLLVNVYGATITGSAVCGNGQAQIHMDAEPGGRSVESDDGVLVMSAALDMTFASNVVSGDDPLLEISIPNSDFAALVGTLTSESNAWLSTGDTGDPFDFPGADGDLERWQDATGQDLGSTWNRDPGAECLAASR